MARLVANQQSVATMTRRNGLRPRLCPSGGPARIITAPRPYLVPAHARGSSLGGVHERFQSPVGGKSEARGTSNPDKSCFGVSRPLHRAFQVDSTLIAGFFNLRWPVKALTAGACSVNGSGEADGNAQRNTARPLDCTPYFGMRSSRDDLNCSI
jgi:hypothetical protein